MLGLKLNHVSKEGSRCNGLWLRITKYEMIRLVYVYVGCDIAA